MRRRRRWPWIIALASVALTAGIFFWPRHDDYDFLRRLHPKESFMDISVGGAPPIRCRRFEFEDWNNEVEETLFKAGAKMRAHFGFDGNLEPGNMTLPNGDIARIERFENTPLFLTIYSSPPTWIQRQMEAIRGFFHL